MVTIESAAERRDGVTLVTATVAGAAAPTRVTLESRLDGPVWPPRRQGEPEAGWTDAGFEGVVPAEGRLAIGFASPAEPVDPPLELVATERAEEPTGDMDTPAAVVRGLGDPTPPALIDVDGAAEGTDESSAAATTDSVNVRENGHAKTPEVTAGDGESTRGTDTPVDRGAGDDASEGSGREARAPVNEDLPPAVARWLADVETRLDCAAGLDPDAAVEEATQALRACGGVEGAKSLEEQLAADARRLRRIRWRAGALEERAEEASVATAALDELS